jgi:hypothetical protein
VLVTLHRLPGTGDPRRHIAGVALAGCLPGLKGFPYLLADALYQDVRIEHHQVAMAGSLAGAVFNCLAAASDSAFNPSLKYALPMAGAAPSSVFLTIPMIKLAVAYQISA